MNDDSDGALVGTMADEEAAMRKGKGSQLLLLGGFAVVLLAGLMFLMGGDDEARVYGELGKSINGLKQKHFDQFLGCAMEGSDIRGVKSNADLSSEINLRAMDKGRAYGLHLRDTCMPKIEELGPALDTLITPPDLAPHVATLSSANGEFRSSFSELIAYLDNPELSYDEAEASRMIRDIAKAWYDFKKAYSAANDAIRAKLEK